ncbi:phosphoribosylformylglycinamidine synthase [Coemansia sp. RSA 2705]|nr:phosphoribosylformylglycinamidine synthase [Coemansia sp. RSA 2705]
MNTDIPQLYVTALSEHTPAAAEALLLTGPENRVSDNHGLDFEKHELADKERGLRVLPRRAFADDFAISQFRLFEYKQINNAGSDCMAEPSELTFVHSEPRLQREAPIRSIEVVQAQGIAEQNGGTAINVLARTNHELGLALATDEIVYLIDAYLGAQAVDAGVARNPTDVGLMMFAQDAKDERIPYPMSPNSAELNMAAVVAHNVHALAIMPYSERVVRKEASSYMPPDDLASWEHGPSIRLFNNTRCWVYRQPNI